MKISLQILWKFELELLVSVRHAASKKKNLKTCEFYISNDNLRWKLKKKKSNLFIHEKTQNFVWMLASTELNSVIELQYLASSEK